MSAQSSSENRSNSLRVLIISHSAVIAVNQQIYVDLAALPGVQVALVLPERWKSEYDGTEILPSYLPDLKFPVFPLPVMRPGSVPTHFYPRLPTAELRAFRPDVVLASQEPYSISGWQSLRLAKTLGVPFVFQTNQNILKRYPPPFVWFESQCLRDAAMGLAYSDEARQVMLEKGRTGPTAVLPYATDVRLFQPRDAGTDVAARAAAVRTRFGLSADDFVVGYVGRLVPEKGLSTLLQSVALLPEETKKLVRILLVGSGVSEAPLRLEADRLGLGGKVLFAGAVAHTEVPDYMATLDVFAIPSRTTPSWKEQFGRVIIEALACGVPVVGSDSGQIPHLIRETGGGIVFPENDASALAAALTIMIGDPIGDPFGAPKARQAFAKRGNRAVQERFTSPAVARQLRDLLQSCRKSS